MTSTSRIFLTELTNLPLTERFPKSQIQPNIWRRFSSLPWPKIVILVRFGIRFSCPLNISSVCHDKNSLAMRFSVFDVIQTHRKHFRKKTNEIERFLERLWKLQWIIACLGLIFACPQLELAWEIWKPWHVGFRALRATTWSALHYDKRFRMFANRICSSE